MEVGARQGAMINNEKVGIDYEPREVTRVGY